ncbi:MAG: NAD-dependent epimerase/dehydratase family protein [Candidatus Lokiarchaeota archaeon]|nr:NAD-dependent epimerase/dehydratase family protein [Candidatus Lokiarchaeota archaeon]
MKNILVTGGTGFIGTHLVRRLSNDGHNLKLLVRETSDISPFEDLKNIEYVIGDVREIDSLYKAVDNVDLIYHLAAYTKMWAKDKSVINDINIKGAENIAKVVLDKNKRLIYISSFITLGGTSEEPVDETFESEEGLLLDYAKTKFQAKKIIKKYIQKGLNVIILYPGIVYGPGDFNIFGQTVYDITAGKFLGCPGKGEAIGSFVYVNDVIEGFISVIERSDLKGNEFILGGINIKFVDWLNLISEIAGNSKKPRHFPMSLAIFYGWLCEIKTKFTKKMPYINRATVKTINHNWAYNSNKAIKVLNYRITPLDVGLQETIAWYRNFDESQNKSKKK